MKNLSKFIIITAACLLVQLYFPWWSALIVLAVFSALLRISPGTAFAFGSGILGPMWMIYAIFLNQTNDGILAARIGELFQGIKASNLIQISTALATLMGGLSAMTGSLFMNMFRKNQRTHTV